MWYLMVATSLFVMCKSVVASKICYSLYSGIKDWVQGFWGYIMAKFESILWQMKKLKEIV